MQLAIPDPTLPQTQPDLEYLHCTPLIVFTSLVLVSPNHNLLYLVYIRYIQFSIMIHE